jgi:predicted nuclease with TOPRIM domain
MYLIDRDELLERINNQKGIYGISSDEIIEFIKKSEEENDDVPELEDEITELEYEISELEEKVSGLEVKIIELEDEISELEK